MAAAASRAEAPGPSGLSFASIRIASFGKMCTRAGASIGSVTMRRASGAEAAADKLRNERRDAEERLRSLWLAIIHLVAAIFTQNQRKIRPQIMSDSRPIFAAGSSVNLCVPCG